MEGSVKYCHKCHKSKPEEAFVFNDKTFRVCSLCKEKHSSYYQRGRAYMASYYKNNRDEILEKRKYYYQAKKLKKNNIEYKFSM